LDYADLLEELERVLDMALSNYNNALEAGIQGAFYPSHQLMKETSDRKERINTSIE